MGELAKLSSTCLSCWGVPWRQKGVLLCTCHTPQGDKHNSRGQGELSAGNPTWLGVEELCWILSPSTTPPRKDCSFWRERTDPASFQQPVPSAQQILQTQGLKE